VQRHSKASSPGSPDPRTPTDWLKGGVLLAAYDARRPTRDVDIQARAIAGDRDDVLQDDVLQLVRDIAAGAMDDGLVFDTDAATADIVEPSPLANALDGYATLGPGQSSCSPILRSRRTRERRNGIPHARTALRRYFEAGSTRQSS
jgi:hypothetical protein